MITISTDKIEKNWNQFQLSKWPLQQPEEKSSIFCACAIFFAHAPILFCQDYWWDHIIPYGNLVNTRFKYHIHPMVGNLERPGQIHVGPSCQCSRGMLQKCHDVMSWRHDVIVTCKTISGTNQHINLITNSFPGFYYTGRSLCQLYNMLQLTHDVMTWRHRDM